MIIDPRDRTAVWFAAFAARLSEDNNHRFRRRPESHTIGPAVEFADAAQRELEKFDAERAKTEPVQKFEIDRETIGEMRAEGLDILVHFFEKNPEATTGEALRYYSREWAKLIGIPGTTIVAQPCMLYTARELVKRKIDVESFNP